MNRYVSSILILMICLLLSQTENLSAETFISAPDLSSDPSYQIDPNTNQYYWSIWGDITFQNNTMYINGGTADSYSDTDGFVFSNLMFSSNMMDDIDVTEASAEIKLLSISPDLLNTSIGISIHQVTDTGTTLQLRILLIRDQLPSGILTLMVTVMVMQVIQ